MTKIIDNIVILKIIYISNDSIYEKKKSKSGNSTSKEINLSQSKFNILNIKCCFLKTSFRKKIFHYI